MADYNHGGARAGAGRKKGSTNLIRIQSLREALDKSLGKPFVDILAETALKFYTDIQNDKNVDSGSRFLLNLAKLVIQPVPTVIETDHIDELTLEEKRDRINNLLMQRELATQATSLEYSQSISPDSGE